MTREGTAEGGDGVVSADGVARSPPRALGRPRSRTLEASTLACHVLTIPPIAALPWRSASPTASSAAPSAGRRPASSCVGSGRGVSRREQARAGASRRAPAFACARRHGARTSNDAASSTALTSSSLAARSLSARAAALSRASRTRLSRLRRSAYSTWPSMPPAGAPPHHPTRAACDASWRPWRHAQPTPLPHHHPPPSATRAPDAFELRIPLGAAACARHAG